MLKMEHIEKAMTKKIVIGSDRAEDGQTKEFVYILKANAFYVYHGKRCVAETENRDELHDMLKTYNSL